MSRKNGHAQAEGLGGIQAQALNNQAMQAQMAEQQGLEQVGFSGRAARLAGQKESPQAAEVRRLNERMRAMHEQLGQLAFQKAQLEAQSAQVVSKLASDGAEADALINAIAREKGINLQEPGWRYDLQTGEFTRAQ